MSTKREMIVLEPDGRIRKEEFCTRPLPCPYCRGKGWFYSGEQEPETIECPDCKGSGEVVALVTIDWQPNKQ